MIKMQALYTWSRTIHRMCVAVMLTFTILMGGTGLLLKYSWVATKLPLDLGMIRYIHNTLSGWFALVLAVMGITGTVMYVYPWYMRRKRVTMPPV